MAVCYILRCVDGSYYVGSTGGTTASISTRSTTTTSWPWSDLFAAGHTGRQQTIAAFKADPLCRHVLAQSLATFSRDKDLFSPLSQMFSERGHDWSVDGAIAFLYGTRGQLKDGDRFGDDVPCPNGGYCYTQGDIQARRTA